MVFPLICIGRLHRLLYNALQPSISIKSLMPEVEWDNLQFHISNVLAGELEATILSIIGDRAFDWSGRYPKYENAAWKKTFYHALIAYTSGYPTTEDEFLENFVLLAESMQPSVYVDGATYDAA